MNFQTMYEKGKEGKNVGLTTGISSLDRAINGVRKGCMITVASLPKAGKSTLVNFSFVLMPYLIDVLGRGKKVHWIYFSFEMSRLAMEFKFAAFFFNYDHNISSFEYNGSIYDISSNYLLGQQIDKDDMPIPVSEAHEEILIEIYRDRIEPIFGKYTVDGKRIKDGVIDFIEERTNPTGLYKYLWGYAERNGNFIYEEYKTVDDNTRPIVKKRVTGYRLNDDSSQTIIILDTIRKVKDERNFNLKQLIDKTLEYFEEYRNVCNYTFVNIIHANRSLSDMQRIKFDPEHLHIIPDDIKDSGNASEASNVVLTLFKPTDEKYNIKKHFGLELYKGKELLYPNYRSLHLVESRDTEAPVHIQLEMLGHINVFKQLEKKI